MTREQVRPLRYFFSEMLDNIDQHSNAQNAVVSCQYIPKRDYIDVCISDNGKSIPQSYEENDIDFDKDYEAVRKALVEGLSTKESDYRGFGLTTNREMVTDGLDGQVIVCSRNAVVKAAPDGYIVSNIRTWEGTTVIARMYDPDDDFTIYKYLESK